MRAALLAAAASIAACRAAPNPAVEHRERSPHFELVTASDDAVLRAEALAELERAAEILVSLYGSTARERLTVRLTEVAAGPAGARRDTLTAEVALNRADLPPGFLPDGARVALAHEAAHLWAFAVLAGEERMPAGLHEGIAEYVAERCELRRQPGVIGASFLRESVPELQRAAARGELLGAEAALGGDPRKAPSPQLATAAAWWLVRTAAAELGDERKLIAELGRLDLRKLEAAAEDALQRARPQWWAIGREVSVTGDSFVLAPIPGSAVWLFEAEPRDSSALEVELRAELITGGAPELRIGFGFDDGENGVQAVLPTSGRATLEAVKEGVAQFGFGGELALRGPLRLTLRREGGEVRITSGPSTIVLPMPRGVAADRGRVGIGAKGGVYRVTALRVQSL